jgi:hypothetical protein
MSSHGRQSALFLLLPEDIHMYFLLEILQLRDARNLVDTSHFLHDRYKKSVLPLALSARISWMYHLSRTKVLEYVKNNTETPSKQLILNFVGNHEVTDVAHLGSTYKIFLRDFTALKSVAGLENVHTVDLTNCGWITDVSPLGK